MITFTTIGLGDMAPRFEIHRDELFRSGAYFLFAICTLLGMALLSSLLSAVAEVWLNVNIQVTGLTGHRKGKVSKKKAILDKYGGGEYLDGGDGMGGGGESAVSELRNLVLVFILVSDLEYKPNHVRISRW